MNLLGNLRHHFFYSLLTKKTQLKTLGSPCAWDFCPAGLNEQSNIVCAGAGGDISFEVELHRMTGAPVHLLDPSPTGIATFNQTSPAGVLFHELGLAGQSKKYTFALPRNPEEGSYKDPRYDSEGMQTITFDCRTIEDFMKQHDMPSLDLLKMDIEGFEYDVLRTILRNRTPIRQICVEFHNLHGRFLSGILRYLWIIRLRLHGYYLISHVGTGDHTFAKL